MNPMVVILILVRFSIILLSEIKIREGQLYTAIIKKKRKKSELHEGLREAWHWGYISAYIDQCTMIIEIELIANK